eukprot:TRINITY_DN1391_c0_g1_i2.p1 TRINITY_DN1391_c0_g1~~TRINITY_DN1391_c0_g1_i2.p1  ORF type:complete len:250 (+),score=73.79 TRINITY_DN1391_c0_g1_i2:98-847(+)
MANLPSQSQITQHSAQVAAIFDAVCTANKALGSVHDGNDRRSYFDCIEVPDLSIKTYMMQLKTMRREAVWPVALILADRYCRMADVPFNPHAMHRLVLVAFVVACKLCYDLCGTSGTTAPRGCVCLEDLNAMERQFLLIIDWNCHVTAAEFAAVIDQLDNIEAAAQHAAQNPTGKPVDLIPGPLVPNMESMVPHPPAQPRSPVQPVPRASPRQRPHAGSVPPAQVCRVRARIEEVKGYAVGQIARAVSV